jgi:hypothetical protein
VEHYNLHPDGTTPSFCNVHLVSGDRRLWHPGEVRNIDGEVPDDLVLDIDVATLLALHRPLGSRTWFAIHAAGYLNPRLGTERAEKIVEDASSAFDDEEHDERMRVVRSFLRKPVDDDATLDRRRRGGGAGETGPGRPRAHRALVRPRPP